MQLRLVLNGTERRSEVESGASLLTALRESFELPGSKSACDQGECGSCSILLDGALVCSCLVMAGAAQDREVRTIESLADGERLHPVQQAFLDAGAVQCGFCTPGFIMATVALLRDNPEPTEAEAREALAGNLCRCTGYGKILEAVQAASRASAP